MRKWLGILLALFMLLTLCACGCAKNADETNGTTKVSETSETSQADETTAGDTAESVGGSADSEGGSESSDGSGEVSSVKQPIDNTGVPEKFWNCENIAADIESFQSEAPWEDENAALKGWSYTILNAYLSGDKSVIDPNPSDYVDEACLSRLPNKESAYGTIDDVEHFYIRDIRRLYGTDQEVSHAWTKTVFALKGQFYELSLFFEMREIEMEWGPYHRWVIVDFEVAEAEVAPAELQKDVVGVQDLAFRFYKAQCQGNFEALKAMVDDPNNPEHSALSYCDYMSHKDLRETDLYSVCIEKTADVEEISVCITFHVSSDSGGALYMGLGVAAEEVKDDAGNVIDRVWKITGCGIDVS